MVLGVSFDSIEENAAFAAKFSFPFRLLSDINRSMGMAYGAAQSPETGSAGRVGVVLDEDGLVLHWAASVNAQSFPQEALDLLS